MVAKMWKTAQHWSVWSVLLFYEPFINIWLELLYLPGNDR